MASVQFELTGGSLTNYVIATGTPTIYGYLVYWNSTSVSDGTYVLQSVTHDPVGLVGTKFQGFRSPLTTSGESQRTIPRSLNAGLFTNVADVRIREPLEVRY